MFVAFRRPTVVFPASWSVQLPLKHRPIQAVDECLQLRGRLPKTSGVPNIIPIGPLYVALCELRTR